MFHGVGFSAQNMYLEEKNLRERLDSILADQRRIGEILQEEPKLAREAGSSSVKPGPKNANYALKVGVISAIEDVAIPPEAPIVTIVTG